MRLCTASLDIKLPTTIKLDFLNVVCIKLVKRLVKCKFPYLIAAFLLHK